MQNSNSFTLKSSGGLLRSLESPCHVAATFDLVSTPPYPEFKEFQAIWDTGATHSVITQRVVDSCGLLPTGMVQVHGVNSVEMSEVYLVNLGLHNKVSVQNVRVSKGRLSPSTDVLIGMDIISIGDFALTNRSGVSVFSFCIPSHRCIDFVEEHNIAQRRTGPGFRAYSPPPPQLVGSKGRKRKR